MQRPFQLVLWGRLPLLGAMAMVLMAAAGALAEMHAVSIGDKKYEPAELRIAAGDSVIWTNADEHDHTIVAEDASFKSGNVSPGERFEHTFSKPGRYPYACTYHPRMKGLIVVE